MKNKIIIVTGCAGMIGYHTVKELIKNFKNYEILGIDDASLFSSDQFQSQRLSELIKFNNFHFLQCNLNEAQNLHQYLSNYNLKGIIHLAAIPGVSQSFYDPIKTLSNNYTSFLNILEFLRIYKLNIPLLYASTSSVYGNNICAKTEENHPLNPISSYAVSKIQNEQLANLYYDSYEINSIGLRFFTVFGPYNRTDMFIYKVLDSIKNGTSLSLYNNGNMQRDFTYVGDVARVLSTLLTQQLNNTSLIHDIFNFGNMSPVSISYICEYLEEKMGKNGNFQKINSYPSYDPLITYCDNSKIMNILNTFDFTPLEMGLDNTANWFKKINK